MVAAIGAAGLVVGCLDRPVAPQRPQTNNVFVAEIRQTAVDKIDLLFMIDNSISMADKQAILGDAVPELMKRLVTPICVDANGSPSGGNADASGKCGNGASPEFSPIKDIHIGVVTSSLGAHGGQQTCTQPKDDDKGQLLGVVRAPDPMYPYATFSNLGFLAWDPNHKYPGGETDSENLNKNFTNMVKSAGQTGCGYEASLEAWYRFLIDPQPPNSVTADLNTNQTVVDASNPDANPVVVQRKSFLRPDSLVAVVMLTDENDCSIRDDGLGWLVGSSNVKGTSFHMWRSTAMCASNPNDPCCFSCGSLNPPASCPSIADDASCKMGSYQQGEDSANLRCYDQKRRFGLDLLYPTSRYVEGLYNSQIQARDGSMVQNPLYAGSPPREKSLVFFAGIVGVPWQDIATPESLTGPGLTYLKYNDMVATVGGQGKSRWDWILGSPGNATTAPGLPEDKLMFETPQDRSMMFPGAMHPAGIANGGPQPPTTTTPNPINGHESVIGDMSDLQYACTFQLPKPQNCEAANGQAAPAACDCKSEDAQYSRSLCDKANPTVQVSAKAYPGLRELQVLKDFGALGTHNSIVASICPKTLDKTNSQSYGYNPAVAAIIERLKEALRGKCLPRKLTPGDDGNVPCSVVEAVYTDDPNTCNCDPAKGRSPASAGTRNAVNHQLQESSYCDVPMQPSCNNYCLCEIAQLPNDDPKAGNAACKTSTSAPTDIYGYCYIDPTAPGKFDGLQSPEARQTASTLVASCPATQQRLLRFAGDNVPAKGAIALIACLGATNDDQY